MGEAKPKAGPRRQGRPDVVASGRANVCKSLCSACGLALGTHISQAAAVLRGF